MALTDNCFVPNLLKLAALMALAATAISGAGAENDVFVQFYMDQVTLWNQQGQQGKLQAAILPGIQAFCGKPANFDTCGINSTADLNFTASSVQISPGYPVNSRGRYLNVRFKISYSVGSTVVTLPASAVREITQNQRETISTDVGYFVVYINNVLYSVPPPAMANKVIVPMFVTGTCLLILVAMIMRHYHASRQRKYMRQLGREPKSNRKNKVGASATDLAAATEEKTVADSKDKSIAGDDKQKKKKKKTLGGVDWGSDKATKGSGPPNRGSEFNNIGFDKSINEGDPRARQAGGGQSDAGGDSSVGDPRASQSALSEVIQVRGGDGDASKAHGGNKKKSKKPHGKHPSGGGGSSGDVGPDKGKKSLSTTLRNKDSEEVMLMDAGVFNPPESNVPEKRIATDDDSDESDHVPTL